MSIPRKMGINLKIKQFWVEKVYHNPEIKEFLGQLETQRDKDIAGLTINFIKKTWPEIAEVLNGELVAENTMED